MEESKGRQKEGQTTAKLDQKTHEPAQHSRNTRNPMSALSRHGTSLASAATRCAVSRVGSEVATGARAGSSWAKNALHGETKAEIEKEKWNFLKTRQWTKGCREFQMLCSSSSASAAELSAKKFFSLWSK